MTVMDAPRTGSIEIARSQTPKVDAIIDRLAGPVWTLLEARRSASEVVAAGMMAAALELVRKEVPGFEEAWRAEYVGITPEEAPQRILRPGCTSMDHTGLDCISALAEGKLADGSTFCDHCSEQQFAQTPAPEAATETGTVVHIITDAGSARATRPAKVRQVHAS